MTKNQINELFYIKKEIAMWEESLIDAKSQINVIAVEDGQAKELTEKDIIIKIERLKKRAENQRAMILGYIMNIGSSIDRQIVYKRCYKLMTWNEIARDIGGNNSIDSIRKRFDRLLPDKK